MRLAFDFVTRHNTRPTFHVGLKDGRYILTPGGMENQILNTPTTILQRFYTSWMEFHNQTPKVILEPWGCVTQHGEVITRGMGKTYFVHDTEVVKEYIAGMFRMPGMIHSTWVEEVAARHNTRVGDQVGLAHQAVLAYEKACLQEAQRMASDLNGAGKFQASVLAEAATSDRWGFIWVKVGNYYVCPYPLYPGSDTSPTEREYGVVHGAGWSFDRWCDGTLDAIEATADAIREKLGKAGLTAEVETNFENIWVYLPRKCQMGEPRFEIEQAAGHYGKWQKWLEGNTRGRKFCEYFPPQLTTLESKSNAK